MKPRCDNPDECYRCLTSPAAPRFAPRLKFIPRSILQACKVSAKLDTPSFEIQSFCNRDLEFKKLSKAAREDLKVFLEEVNSEKAIVDKYMAEQAIDEERVSYDPLEHHESHVLFKIDTELHRAFSRLNNSISSFSNTLGSTFITFKDISGYKIGYGEINYWHVSALQDAYLLRTRLFMAMDFIYALHLAESSTAIDYTEWKSKAVKKFNIKFNISSRNRLIHTRFLDARSPVLMYIVHVGDDIRERFLKDARIQQHLSDEKISWEQYVKELRTAVLSYSDFISESVRLLNILNQI
ncbi:hypothetical protein F6V30_03735 [Oryzomonas sagensis]|uniref:Uncharacterized protein n=1 Tax=Oryzomonas sagensis TaxID=2603857 RepID=A0ABQ6TRP8_9BACT|nr:hypothetical protein [Oryzomonas sagensis]KAB0671700.1 hypothetical protein F6V30_03735 [Oryzomonas sagensis]